MHFNVKNSRTIIIVVIILAMLALIANGKNIVEFALVEKKTVTVGNFRGFEIGSTKDVVFQRLKTLEVGGIAGIAQPYFILKKNDLSSINSIISADTIIFDNNDGWQIKLQFEASRVSEIKLSFPAKGNDWFSIGENVHSIVAKIPKILKEHPALIVFPGVRHPGWIYLNRLSEADEKLLFAYHAWNFQGTGADINSNFQMYFENGKLQKIKYIRPRIELF